MLKLARVGLYSAGVVLFQNQFLTGVVLLIDWDEVLFKSGVVFSRIRYLIQATSCELK